MIPVAPLPLIVPLIYLSSFVAGIWLLVWLSLLAFSPRARQRLRRRWPSRGLLMLLLLIPLGLRAWLEIGLWQYERERAREEAAHSAVLERPSRLGGIEMPAGTRLKLELKHQPESFREAEFPIPVTIRGVATRHLQRWLQSEQDDPQDPWKTTGVHPTSLRLRGEGVAEIEGWRCDASQEIAFASERDGRPAAFEGCSLATGNPGTTRRAPRSAFRPAPPGARNIRTPGCSVLPAKPLRMPPASAWNTAPRCCRRWTARNSSASTTARQESSTSSNWRSATTAEPAPRGYLRLSQQRGGKGNQEMDEAHGPSVAITAVWLGIFPILREKRCRFACRTAKQG